MTATHKLGVIIPYRDRAAHLEELLPDLVRTLEMSTEAFAIYVVEQLGDDPFNRGALANYGAYRAAFEECDYIAIHDVDMVPVPGKVDYGYVAAPTHLAARVQQFSRRLDHDPPHHEEDPQYWGLCYDQYFGGVSLIPLEVFRATNGYSNQYWGWGAEDDDYRLRLQVNGHRYIETGMNGAPITLPFRRRPGGMFRSLSHERNGWEAPGGCPPETRINAARFTHVSSHGAYPDATTWHTEGFNMINPERIVRIRSYLSPPREHLFVELPRS